jgi:hypothetical protein
MSITIYNKNASEENYLHFQYIASLIRPGGGESTVMPNPVLSKGYIYFKVQNLSLIDLLYE